MRARLSRRRRRGRRGSAHTCHFATMLYHVVHEAVSMAPLRGATQRHSRRPALSSPSLSSVHLRRAELARLSGSHGSAARTAQRLARPYESIIPQAPPVRQLIALAHRPAALPAPRPSVLRGRAPLVQGSAWSATHTDHATSTRTVHEDHPRGLLTRSATEGLRCSAQELQEHQPSEHQRSKLYRGGEPPRC